MAVDIKLLKELRAITHAPLGICKSSLEEADGSIERAQEILREKGALKAGKKADRETKEGVIIVESFGDKVVGLKLACETDFVAKNDTFQGLGRKIIQKIRVLSDVSSYGDIEDEMKNELEKILKDNFVTIGENMKISEVFAKEGKHYIYRHAGNKLASIVFYSGEETVAKNVALQVAAMNPSYLSIEDVPSDIKNKYREEFEIEVKGKGKPENIVDRIVEGKLGKMWSEMVLLEQLSIVDDSKKIKEILGDTKVLGYIRLAI